MNGLRETNEDTMMLAHACGMAYWRMNQPYDATRDGLERHARTCGWYGEDNQAWLAGFYGAKRRDTNPRWNKPPLHGVAS